MGDEVLVKVESVSKKFCRDLKKSLWYGVQDIGEELFGRNKAKGDLRPEEFWALKDISFELRRGECLGLIGRNGAGKTTLLRMLNNLIKPDTGRVVIRGTVGALIALGAGFNPVLTGGENIYVYGAVLGLSKDEIDAKFDEIVDFAELWDFIDSPVQTYSSGMQVRLGFSVATALEPDILLMDEILAVGDASFRNKCYKRLGQIRRNSATILVSHSMEQILQNCSKCMVLEEGRVLFQGSTSTAIDLYEQLNASPDSDETPFESVVDPIESFDIDFRSLHLNHGDNVELQLRIISRCDVSSVTIRVMIYSHAEQPIAEWNSKRKGLSYSLDRGENAFDIRVGPLLFKAGSYPIGVIVTEDIGGTPLVWSFKKHKVDLKAWTSLGAQIVY